MEVGIQFSPDLVVFLDLHLQLDPTFVLYCGCKWHHPLNHDVWIVLGITGHS